MAGVGPRLVQDGSLTAQDATQRLELGAERTDSNGNVFVYVKAFSALKKGYVVGWLGSTTAHRGWVTPTRANSIERLPAGVCLYSQSATKFGYIQRLGVNQYCNSKSAVAQTATLYWGSNKVATQIAAGQEHMRFGTALKADSGSVIPMLRITHTASPG